MFSNVDYGKDEMDAFKGRVLVYLSSHGISTQNITDMINEEAKFSSEKKALMELLPESLDDHVMQWRTALNSGDEKVWTQMVHALRAHLAEQDGHEHDLKQLNALSSNHNIAWTHPNFIKNAETVRTMVSKLIAEGEPLPELPRRTRRR